MQITIEKNRIPLFSLIKLFGVSIFFTEMLFLIPMIIWVIISGVSDTFIEIVKSLVLLLVVFSFGAVQISLVIAFPLWVYSRFWTIEYVLLRNDTHVELEDQTIKNHKH